ncbi:MAG: hypothetical protein RKO24_16320, partial [Candidatus Competibacter sp.]|nr:hypothetical protein [Candidatus Competibacter sp.]
DGRTIAGRSERGCFVHARSPLSAVVDGDRPTLSPARRWFGFAMVSMVGYPMGSGVEPSRV